MILKSELAVFIFVLSFVSSFVLRAFVLPFVHLFVCLFGRSLAAKREEVWISEDFSRAQRKSMAPWAGVQLL